MQTYVNLSSMVILILQLVDDRAGEVKGQVVGSLAPDVVHQASRCNILRAQNILNELNQSLDLQQGGELARTLRQLYDYMDRRLTESNLTKTQEGLKETIMRLGTLRGAWSEMLTQLGSSDTEHSSANSLCACV